MASTINKNTLGNYELEQIALKKQNDYYLFSNAANGCSYQTHYPGNGLLPARIAPQANTQYSCDIESMLYGIASSNLVSCRPSVYGSLDVSLEKSKYQNVKTLNIVDRPILYVPSPMIPECNDPRPLIR